VSEKRTMRFNFWGKRGELLFFMKRYRRIIGRLFPTVNEGGGVSVWFIQFHSTVLYIVGRRVGHNIPVSVKLLELGNDIL